MTRKTWLIMVVIGAVLVTAAVGGYYYYQSQITETDSSEETVKWDLSRLTSSTGGNIQVLDYSDLNLSSVSDIYNVSNQEAIEAKVEALKSDTHYSLDAPLLISDPYLTNTTGLYVYFSTDEAVQISYTISAEGYEDYTAVAYNAAGTYATEHEFQLIGSVAGVENTITLTAKTETGTESTYKFTYTPNELQSVTSNAYDTEDGDSTEKLTDGLYAIIGNQASDVRSTLYVDNNGIVRGEVPIIYYNSMRLNITSDNQMYLGISSGAIAKITNLGQVTQVIDVASQGYSLHHDFVLDNEGNILALATSTEKETDDNYVEDQIVKIDTTTGNITTVLDMESLLPELYEVATDLEEHSNDAGKYDPIHLNTIQMIDNDTIIVSSRETSTIIKIENLTTNPTISYMISDESVWDGVGDYSNLLLNQVGNFLNSAGQHTVTYETDDSLEEGQYYLYMFDNNYEMMDSRQDFDWSAYKSTDYDVTVEDDVSMYYKYLVDENEGSYELVESFEVPYSAYVSSAQEYKENIIMAPGRKNMFIEYDSKGNAIRTFTYTGDSFLTYRTFKYDFKDFYFAE